LKRSWVELVRFKVELKRFKGAETWFRVVSGRFKPELFPRRLETPWFSLERFQFNLEPAFHWVESCEFKPRSFQFKPEF